MAESLLDSYWQPAENDRMCLAIPGRVIEISGDVPLLRQAVVDFGGVRKSVNLAFVPEAAIDDFVLVHVGFAIARIDEAEARRVFIYLKEIEELSELDEPGRDAR